MAEKSLRQLILDIDRKFGDQIAAMDRRLSDQLSAMDKKFNRRLSVMDEKFGGQLLVMDQKIAALDSKFDQKFEESDHKIDSVIGLVLDMKQEMVTKAELREVRTDTKVIKFAITHLSEQLNSHINDKRIHVNV